MSAVIADTHTILWYLFGDKRLSTVAYQTLRIATTIYIPAIVLVEITYLHERQRIPAQAWLRLSNEVTNPDSRLKLIPIDWEIILAMRQIPATAVPDMPDRLIAATAYALGFPLVTQDGVLQASSQIETIW